MGTRDTRPASPGLKVQTEDHRTPTHQPQGKGGCGHLPMTKGACGRLAGWEESVHRGTEDPVRVGLAQLCREGKT